MGYKKSLSYFSGQVIGKNILSRLETDQTCTLHGDYCHLYNQVWPKLFGEHHFVRIKNFLKGMLESRTIKDWEYSYNSARSLLLHVPHLAEKLDSIHELPLYYAGSVVVLELMDPLLKRKTMQVSVLI